MEKHRNGYPLVQIYKLKIKMLLYSAWCNRVLSIHYRKIFNLLCHEDEAWKKKESESRFDVIVGSNNSTEICELTGIYILSQLSNILSQKDIGLYRDNGLILRQNTNRQLTNIIRKNVIKLFKGIGFKIEIETNLKVVNFLDVTFNMTNST